MSYELSGLKDKLYWRPTGRSATIHCFRRRLPGEVHPWEFVSLCGEQGLNRVGGQASMRPRAVLRCARCDCLEIERRGWAESGPALDGSEPSGARPLRRDHLPDEEARVAIRGRKHEAGEPYSGEFRARIDPELHKRVALLAAEFNRSVTEQVEAMLGGRSPPLEPYSGEFIVRVDPAIHKRVARRAAEQERSMNEQVGAELAERAAQLEAQLHRRGHARD